MRLLLTVSAVVEGATGLALVIRPSALAALLLGAPLHAPVGVAVGRIAGIALAALGLACWLTRVDGQGRAARGLVFAMLLYNGGALAVLVSAGLGSGLAGIGLWPAALAHFVLGIWCARSLVSKHA